MSVSDVASSGTGTVHGVIVGQVSPVKSSTRSDVKYFEGQISDGVKTVRLVSFEPSLRSQIEEAQKAKVGVALRNCAFKRSRGSEDFEIHANKKTSILLSPKKYKAVEEGTADIKCMSSSTLGTAEELKEITKNQHICISGKMSGFPFIGGGSCFEGIRKAVV